MYNISDKYKPYLIFLLKLLIVLAASYFIYYKLNYNNQLSFEKFKITLFHLFENNLFYLLFLIVLTDINWVLEIIKWQLLVNTFKNISFFDAYQQTLVAHTVSFFTPNKLGEYPAKMLFFKKKFRKKILALNFIGNFGQLLTTILFGIVGNCFILYYYNINLHPVKLKYVFIALIFVISIFLILIFTQGIETLRKLFNKGLQYFKNIAKKIYFNVTILSVLRYLVFSHQFYYLMVLYNVEIHYFTLLPFIFAMYFLASIIPVLAIFDWVIKGSIAVWLFSYLGINQLTMLTITTIMWILNFAIPAIIGSVFVLHFKPLER